MYYLVELQDIVRVPPKRFNEDLESVVLDISRDTYEETIDPELGMVLAIVGAVLAFCSFVVPFLWWQRRMDRAGKKYLKEISN